MSFLDKLKSMFSGGSSAGTDAHAGHDHSHDGDDHTHEPAPATPDPVPAPNPVAEDETKPE